MADVYYSPEKYGMTTVAEIDYSSGSYEFDLRVVWKTSEGRLLTARDAGCSCPSPFEDTDFNDLEEFDYAALRRELHGELDARHGYISHTQARDFLDAVRHALPCCPECHQHSFITRDDYICTSCREAR